MKGNVRAFLCQVVRTVNCVTCHRNGRVTYYCPVRCQWVENAETITVAALTVLPMDEEARVRRHLARHGVFL
jgi:hypothetical protein